MSRREGATPYLWWNHEHLSYRPLIPGNHQLILPQFRCNGSERRGQCSKLQKRKIWPVTPKNQLRGKKNLFKGGSSEVRSSKISKVDLKEDGRREEEPSMRKRDRGGGGGFVRAVASDLH